MRLTLFDRSTDGYKSVPALHHSETEKKEKRRRAFYCQLSPPYHPCFWDLTTKYMVYIFIFIKWAGEPGFSFLMPSFGCGLLLPLHKHPYFPLPPPIPYSQYAMNCCWTASKCKMIQDIKICQPEIWFSIGFSEVNVWEFLGAPFFREGVKKQTWNPGASRMLLTPTGTLKTPWGGKGLALDRALFWSIWGFPYFGQFRVPCIAPRLKSAVHR